VNKGSNAPAWGPCLKPIRLRNDWNFSSHGCTCHLTFWATEPRDVIEPPPFTEHGARKDVGPTSEGHQHVGEVAREGGRVASMFFRPEEVHTRSTKRSGFRISSNCTSTVPNDRRWAYRKDFLVTHFDRHGITAIETRCVNANQFPREQPTNGQRLKSALRKPALFAVDGNSILRRLIVERWE
jgi:hypothetical protein